MHEHILEPIALIEETVQDKKESALKRMQDVSTVWVKVQIHENGRWCRKPQVHMRIRSKYRGSTLCAHTPLRDVRHADMQRLYKFIESKINQFRFIERYHEGAAETQHTAQNRKLDVQKILTLM